MKIKKYALSILCLILCSCTNSPEDLSTVLNTSETKNTSSEPEINQTTTLPVITLAPENAANAEYFIDYTNQKVFYSDAAKIEYCGEPISAEDASVYKDAFFYFDKWTYGVFSKGICLNSVNDEFDIDEYKFKEEPIVNEEYKLSKINLGDSFGGLTVSAVSCTLVPTGEDYYPNGIYMFDSDLELEGELEITGYIKAMEKFEGYYYEGDIIFLVDKNQWNNIPILIHPKTNNPYKPYTYYTETFQQFSDTPILRLGSIITDYSDMDTDIIPDDGTFTHAKITISDIKLHASEGISTAEARMINIQEIIE